jgi:glutamate:GABA antiporter
MGFWDVLLFCVATVLGPRWIAFAAFIGPSSLCLWLLAALLFFVPSAFVISELSTRFPREGGLYAWTKEAFGEFHGFVAGWTYWIYTVFYFPALLVASLAMSAYIGGSNHALLANNRSFLIFGSLALLGVAVSLNIVGLNIGKWLQNAGGVATYVPLLILVGVAIAVWDKQGSVTHFSIQNLRPHLFVPAGPGRLKLDFDNLNYWSAIAFAFTGLELVSTMSDEIRDPQRTIPRAIFISGFSIALIYIMGTLAVLTLLPSTAVDSKTGVFQAITQGSANVLGLGFLGVLAALIVTVGNAGGVGSTVAGIARVPFVVGIDNYLPSAFGKIHPKWKTPYVSMLVQAALSAVVLLVFQINESMAGAYQILIDATVVLYFLPFLYMYAAVIRLSYRTDRKSTPGGVLIPGGRAGVWVAGSLGFLVTMLSIIVAVIPPGSVQSRWGFELKLLSATAIGVVIGLILYWRGARKKSHLRLSQD